MSEISSLITVPKDLFVSCSILDLAALYLRKNFIFPEIAEISLLLRFKVIQRIVTGICSTLNILESDQNWTLLNFLLSVSRSNKVHSIYSLFLKAKNSVSDRNYRELRKSVAKSRTFRQKKPYNRRFWYDPFTRGP